MVYNLSETAGLHQLFLSQLRDKEIQKDRFRFRKNMERLGQLLAYEISKKMPFITTEVETPLGKSPVKLSEAPVLCCILRAGLPFFQGFQDFFNESDAGFIGAYRGSSRQDHSFEIELDYLALPDSTGKKIILIDPMLATGKSMVKAARALTKGGNPAGLIVASLIASPEGIAFLQRELPEADIWTIAIDDCLNDHAYIVPGLGDAGDLSFGEKL